MSLSSRLRSGETVFSAWSALPNPLTIEAVAKAGFDAVTMDMQHGGHDVASVLGGIGLIVANGRHPAVRVPLNDFAMVSRALDFGAEAVIAPMINSVEDAQRLAAVAKYPPLGERSWGQYRRMEGYGQSLPSDYLTVANEASLVFAMVETRAAYEILDDILAVPGIDGIFVGPSDFSIAWSDGAEVNAASETIIEPLRNIAERVSRAGKIPAAYALDAKMARRFTSLGYRFLTVGSDSTYLRLGVQMLLDEINS
ncbi:MAG: HpcH/HpaI aldolase family protein [Phyllobacterium sp.]